MIKLFKNTDFLVVVCNAAGLSAFHFIERGMAPLSKELAGVLLPHDAFGSHLDENDVTVNAVKEVQNFKKARFKFYYFVNFIIVLIIFLVLC